VLLLLLLLIVYELGYLCGALELVLLYIYMYIYATIGVVLCH